MFYRRGCLNNFLLFTNFSPRVNDLNCNIDDTINVTYCLDLAIISKYADVIILKG